MLQLWGDCETTGIDPSISGAFEFAFLVYDNGLFKEERVFHLNPLTETILWSEEAYRVNGVSEETIRAYPPAETVMREIAIWLLPYLFPGVSDKAELERKSAETQPDNKFVFAGYCANFDYGHLKALFERHDISMSYFFDGRIIDVYELVKQAYAKRVIKYTPNKKLETMTKALGIPHDSAHTALSDIWATRKLYETIYAMGRRGK